MAKFALIFSVVLVLVLVSVLVESTPQDSPYFNMFNWLYQGVNRSGRPAGGPRRGGGGRSDHRFRSRFDTSGRSRSRTRSRSSDNGKGKYWNNYDKDGYGRNGRDVSHVLAAANTVLTSHLPKPADVMRR